MALSAVERALWQEGEEVGVWLEPGSGQGSTSRNGSQNRRESIGPRPIKRVAFVGGTKFDRDALGRYLAALRAKYPTVTVVTGHGRGAEKAVSELASEFGLALDVIEPIDGLTDSDVTYALVGSDAIVTVGSPTGKRAALAGAIHKRTDASTKHARPLVNVARA